MPPRLLRIPPQSAVDTISLAEYSPRPFSKFSFRIRCFSAGRALMAILPVSQSAHSAQSPVPLAPVPFIDLVAQHQTISGEIREAVDRVFGSQLFVLGEEVAQFETESA